MLHRLKSAFTGLSGTLTTLVSGSKALDIAAVIDEETCDLNSEIQKHETNLEGKVGGLVEVHGSTCKGSNTDDTSPYNSINNKQEITSASPKVNDCTLVGSSNSSNASPIGSPSQNSISIRERLQLFKSQKIDWRFASKSEIESFIYESRDDKHSIDDSDIRIIVAQDDCHRHRTILFDSAAKATTEFSSSHTKHTDRKSDHSVRLRSAADNFVHPASSMKSSNRRFESAPEASSLMALIFGTVTLAHANDNIKIHQISNELARQVLRGSSPDDATQKFFVTKLFSLNTTLRMDKRNTTEEFIRPSRTKLSATKESDTQFVLNKTESNRIEETANEPYNDELTPIMLAPFNADARGDSSSSLYCLLRSESPRLDPTSPSLTSNQEHTMVPTYKHNSAESNLAWNPLPMNRRHLIESSNSLQSEYSQNMTISGRRHHSIGIGFFVRIPRNANQHLFRDYGNIIYEALDDLQASISNFLNKAISNKLEGMVNEQKNRADHKMDKCIGISLLQLNLRSNNDLKQIVDDFIKNILTVWKAPVIKRITPRSLEFDLWCSECMSFLKPDPARKEYSSSTSALITYIMRAKKKDNMSTFLVLGDTAESASRFAFILSFLLQDCSTVFKDEKDLKSLMKTTVSDFEHSSRSKSKAVDSSKIFFKSNKGWNIPGAAPQSSLRQSSVTKANALTIFFSESPRNNSFDSLGSRLSDISVRSSMIKNLQNWRTSPYPARTGSFASSHHSSARVDSEYGRGSSFSVEDKDSQYLGDEEHTSSIRSPPDNDHRFVSCVGWLGSDYLPYFRLQACSRKSNVLLQMRRWLQTEKRGDPCCNITSGRESAAESFMARTAVAHMYRTELLHTDVYRCTSENKSLKGKQISVVKTTLQYIDEQLIDFIYWCANERNWNRLSYLRSQLQSVQ